MNIIKPSTPMKLKPNDVIMIGDSYEKDIIGANNAGIESIHLQV